MNPVNSLSTNPQSLQRRSTFLRLPLEIRTLILRSLLVSARPIPVAREGNEAHEEFVHVALLWTCQQLYREGLVLFRKHNVPRILATLILAEPWVVNWHTGRDGPLESIAYNSFLSDTVSKFSALCLEVTHTSKTFYKSYSEPLHKLMKRLAGCSLGETHLTIVFSPQYLVWFKQQEYFDSDWIGSIGVLRCKKLSLPGIDETLVSGVIQVVEGRLSAADLEKHHQELLDHLETCRHAARNAIRPSRDEAALATDLTRAVRRYDLVKLEHARAAILNHCDGLVKEFMRRHDEFKATMSRSLSADSAALGSDTVK